jgi:hypothetical protein
MGIARSKGHLDGIYLFHVFQAITLYTNFPALQRLPLTRFSQQDCPRDQGAMATSPRQNVFSLGDQFAIEDVLFSTFCGGLVSHICTI